MLNTTGHHQASWQCRQGGTNTQEEANLTDLQCPNITHPISPLKTLRGGLRGGLEVPTPSPGSTLSMVSGGDSSRLLQLPPAPSRPSAPLRVLCGRHLLCLVEAMTDTYWGGGVHSRLGLTDLPYRHPPSPHFKFSHLHTYNIIALYLH